MCGTVSHFRNDGEPKESTALDTERADGSYIHELITAADIATGRHEGDEAVRTLTALGIHRVDAAPGARFDPAVHRAVAVAPAPNPDRANTVAETVRPGWRAQDRMVRYVEVRVFVAPAPGPANGVGG